MFVFGGWNGKDYYNDLHILDLEIMAWKRANPSGPAPSPRQGHASILIGNNLLNTFQKNNFTLFLQYK